MHGETPHAEGCSVALALADGRGYVSAQPGGAVRLVRTLDAPTCMFRHTVSLATPQQMSAWQTVAHGVLSVASILRTPTAPVDLPPAAITPADVQAYERDGFVVLRGAVPPAVLDPAIAVMLDGIERGVHQHTALLGIFRQVRKKKKKTIRR